MSPVFPLKKTLAAVCALLLAGTAAYAEPTPSADAPNAGTGDGSAVCRGKIINPITDVCWSCVFPVRVAGKIPVGKSGPLPDPDTGTGAFCTCGKGLTVRVGLTMSFWEPLRTAEVVRHAGCLPSLGGASLGDLGLRVSDHVKTTAKTGDGSMRRHTDFRQVHWYQTPWLFLLEVLLDHACLEQAAWDLAYLSELDPLWDDTLAAFLLAPDAALFANPIAQGACAADCLAASTGLPRNDLYWCSGCQGNVFPLTGWTASLTSHVAVWELLAHRFAMKLAREGLLLGAHGKQGLCGAFYEPLMRKDVWRTQIVWPTRGDSSRDGTCCHPLGRTTMLSGAGRAYSPGGEDGAVLLWRRRDCCSTTNPWQGK